jgi:hypothetical protein
VCLLIVNALLLHVKRKHYPLGNFNLAAESTSKLNQPLTTPSFRDNLNPFFISIYFSLSHSTLLSSLAEPSIPSMPVPELSTRTVYLFREH